MIKNILSYFTLFIASGAFTQVSGPYQPDWGFVTKTTGDSCGAYFNNYIGLHKTSNIFSEEMRTGDVVSDYYYGGRAQRFTVSQPVEVSGVEFYAYETSPLDSVMVITTLYPYNALNDSLGPEITRDTVYVKHTAFTPVLPNISVKSYFDAPVVMTSDFVIGMHTTLDVSLHIITNDYTTNEGDGEGLSFGLYNNPLYPVDSGWYSALNYMGYDYDYLMNPLVKYDLYTPFSILDDTICPAAINAGCVSYTHTGNFTNHMYNSQYNSPNSHIVWLWGDGYQNVDILNACHTYANPGSFNITLKDSLFRYDVASPYCIVNFSQPIVVLDAPNPDFSFVQDGLSADFTNLSTNSDSVWWDFGDLSAGTDLDNPSHVFSAVGTYNVWLHAYNKCHEDSTMQIVFTDDVGLVESVENFSIYPNPASSNVVISGLNGDCRIELVNILGEVILEVKTSSTQETLSVASLPTGTYFVRVISANNQVTKKLVVRH